MDFVLNSYSAVLLISSLLVFGLSAYIVSQVDETLRWIAFAMICFSIWGFFYGVELTVQTVDQMLIWSKVQYIGLVLAPACWLIFTLKYTGYDDQKNIWIYPVVFALPFITYILVLTNSWHGLHYKSTWLITEGPFPLLGIEKGPYYIVQVIYAYVYYAIGTWILWKAFKSANLHFKTLTRILIVAGFLPILVNILYQLSWFKPFEGLDFTPYAFVLTYILIGIAIIRFNFLNIKPIARDKILEVMTRGVLVFDHRNKLIDFNPKVKEYFTAPDLIYLNQSAEVLFANQPAILTLLTTDLFDNNESKIRIKGSGKIYEIERIRLLNDRSLISGNLMLFEDITSEVLIKEKLEIQTDELRKLNELKDKYFSILSHDLKGPVFGVKELIYLTHTGVISGKEFMEMLPEVSKNMEHVAILLENLLAWTSSQIRGEYLQLQRADLARIIQNQKNLLDRIANEKQITINLDTDEPIWVMADKNMMELVFRNLISNAIKFSPPNSQVDLYTTSTSSEVQVHVKDYGLGISPENIKKLDSGISFSTRGQSNESGTGLGMLMVKEYITKNHGSLKIYSRENEGSEFTVVLPLAEEES